MSSKNNKIKDHIRSYYRHLYSGSYRCTAPIERGKDLALKLGYPPEIVGKIPAGLWDHFVPCGYPFAAAATTSFLGRGLNLGCGASIDSMVLLHGKDSPHSIVNLDSAVSILQRAATKLAPLTALGNRVSWCCGDGEQLPFRDRSFDWVLLNGVSNLFPDKRSLFREIARVMKESGLLLICDLFLNGPIPSYFLDEPDAWVWCMNGAETPRQTEKQLAACGFTDCRFTAFETVDTFTRGAMTAVRNTPAAN